MADRHVVQFPSGHIVTFPEGTPEKEVARQAAHINYFSLSKLASSIDPTKAGEQGAPADFGGPVIPNPKGLKPQLDTENPPLDPRQMTMSTKDAPITGIRPPVTKGQNWNAPQMRIDNAPIPGLKGAEFDKEPRLQ